MSDDWKARLAGLLAMIERERTQVAARNARIAAMDLHGHHSGGAKGANE